ncbi:leucine-rich repeat and immunoglobulin-like domain-containing nogo receptor-interacting protein 1 isoform X2 [Coccinella septempunctata]|nr:leucine-rich repeat and immunoglobulin-like domain-containing nogo receptor-interacting protein 1 isoform X2 [Coccinella septempunctata]
MRSFVVLVALISILETGNSTDCKNEPRCQISRVYGMRAADCSDRKFKYFPQCIRSDIEVIDLAMNRIRKLRFADLERYRNLKALYLQDNALAKLEEDTFDGLDDLTGLDISGASHVKIPPNIFRLPSLQTLYLSQQMNSNIVEVLETTKPITCPLVHLDISYSEIERLPEMGLLPTLVKYNVSGNNLFELGVKHFSGLCGLRHLITENVSLSLTKPCECWNTNRWLISKGFKDPPFDCQLKDNLCEEVPFNSSDKENYEKCSILLGEIARRSLLKKVLLPLATVMLVILLCIFCYFRRRRRYLEQPSYRIPAEEESMNSLPLKKIENS